MTDVPLFIDSTSPFTNNRNINSCPLGFSTPNFQSFEPLNVTLQLEYLRQVDLGGICFPSGNLKFSLGIDDFATLSLATIDDLRLRSRDGSGVLLE